MNWSATPPPQVLIRPLAFQKLRLYIELCPMEIGGLGAVERSGPNFVITDLFILPQKISPAETELDPAAIFEILQGCVAEGRDPASLCLWWHSHAEMDVEWSETDERTIESFPGDFMLSVVGNKAGAFACRLDILRPTRQVLADLPVTIIPDGGEEVDEGALRAAIIAEMCEKLQVITRDFELYDSPVDLEFLSRFQQDLCRPGSPTDDR
ncbi:MAG TPA: hypothetical protein VFM04_04850 [Candidatus Methylomirabilis sp.]|nr:hypothetical protein [Candidatus Methylomirabilis sp.]